MYICIYLFICMCVCVCWCIYMCIYISLYMLSLRYQVERANLRAAGLECQLAALAAQVASPRSVNTQARYNQAQG